MVHVNIFALQQHTLFPYEAPQVLPAVQTQQSAIILVFIKPDDCMFYNL
jgi:hypothetical protein